MAVKLKEKNHIHVKISDIDHRKLAEAKIKTGISMSGLVNIMINMFVRFIDKDYNMKIDYSKYHRILPSVNYDKSREKAPHLVINKDEYLLMKNIKNRNFRMYFAVIIRICIDKLLKELVKNILANKRKYHKDYKLKYSFTTLVHTSPKHNFIKSYRLPHLLL